MCTVMAYISPSVNQDTFKKALQKTQSRGPDATSIYPFDQGVFGFQRLSIMGLTKEGMQPFFYKKNICICNGEIYGFRPLKDNLISKGYTFKSDSDCEILLYLYEEMGIHMFEKLDAEFAMILWDDERKKVIAARDPIGIRPLFYGYDPDGNIVFASEAKNLVGLVTEMCPFPPGHYYINGQFICYRDVTEVDKVVTGEIDTICDSIHDLLVKGIEKRLDSDAPVGFLLSGGLDSSLVCAISQNLLNAPIKTYAIGMSSDAIDLKYAREVADFIHSDHTEILIGENDVIQALRPVIESLATWDITTIRASIGMYLICKEIHRISDTRVLLTGEISDELFGYKYTDFAPDAMSFQKESQKRMRELYMYDVLRADRCISTHSMEARVPFGDLDFVHYVMNIDPSLKMNTYNKGKYLLRHAFEKDDILPRSILMREKAAFSDAVGHSLADTIKAYAEQKYTDQEFTEKCKKYLYATPFTKESLLYREVFEEYYPGQASMITDYWMPNKDWQGCDVNDPSARYLSNYGDSGK